MIHGRVLPEVISLVVAPSDSSSSSRTCVNALSGNNDLQHDLIFRREDYAGSKHFTANPRMEIFQHPIDRNRKWGVRTDLWYLRMLMSRFWCLVVSMLLRIINIHTLSWIRGLWLHSRESLKPYMKACLSYHVSVSYGVGKNFSLSVRLSDNLTTETNKCCGSRIRNFNLLVLHPLSRKNASSIFPHIIFKRLTYSQSHTLSQLLFSSKYFLLGVPSEFFHLFRAENLYEGRCLLLPYHMPGLD
jgi:hypothetical protein